MAPIKHTCPQIDKCIKYIKLSQNSIYKTGDDDLDRLLDDMNDTFNYCISTLEELRESNDTLRSWGSDLEDENGELNRRISDLEDEVVRLEDELSKTT